LHPIPFSFPPRHGERKTKSGANITVNPEKQRSTTNYFRETALQTPETTIFVSWIFHFDIPQKTIALHCPWLTISPGSVMPSGFWSVAAPAASQIDILAILLIPQTGSQTTHRNESRGRISRNNDFIKPTTRHLRLFCHTNSLVLHNEK
jgi:hypothetical protein